VQIYTTYPYSNGITFLHTGVNDAMVAGREDVREIQGIFIRNLLWNGKKVNFAYRYADVFCLTSRETTSEVRVTEETGIACSIHIILQTKRISGYATIKRSCVTNDDVFVLSQKEESFCLQYRHFPHAIWKEATTRWPMLRFLTFGPTRSTMPIN